jgi:hypothetical protein
MAWLAKIWHGNNGENNGIANGNGMKMASAWQKRK